MQLDHFAVKAAAWATQADLATLLHAPLLALGAAIHHMPTYPLYVLCHEVHHSLEDWTGKHLVEDGVPPEQDREVMASLSSFVQQSGGWPAIQARYLV